MVNVISCAVIFVVGLVLWSGCGPEMQDTSGPLDQTGGGSIAPGGLVAGGQSRSDGAPAAGGGSAGATGAAGTSQAGGEANETPSSQPVGWLTYRDQAFGFSIAYPDIYAIVPEPAPPETIAPNLLQRVRFLDHDLAASDTAALQPPNFSVEVFENPAQSALDVWLDANAPHGERASFTVAGLSGIKLSLLAQMAPGELYYVASGNKVYKLTPLGQYGDQMLDSFRLAAAGGSEVAPAASN